MAFSGTELYKSRDQILQDLITGMQALIPDLWVGPDGNVYMLFQVEASQLEGLYLANQILLEDMFVPTASLTGLLRFGDMYGIPQKEGTPSVGSLLFSGTGGVFIPVGTEVAYDPGGGNDPLYFLTIESGTLPAPGIPSAPTIATGGAGNITGTMEYAITFLTSSGETLQGPDSNVLVAASNSVNITNIAIGGPGTTGRKVYRSKNGGLYQFVAQLSDNSTLVYTDNITDGSLGGNPPAVSTAEQALLDANSETSGIQYNAVPGAITVLTNVPDGINSVTNPTAFSGGTDIESTEAYRSRMLEFIRNPQSGSANDLLSWALSVDGVSTATVFTNDNLGTPTNGHATIRVAGPNGSTPSGAVLAAVLATVNQHDLANITIHVTTFTSVTTNVAVTITVATGYVLADISPSISQAIVDYVNSVPVGGTVYIAGIVDAVFGLPGVANVVVTTPATDQTTASTSKRIPGTVTVT